MFRTTHSSSLHLSHKLFSQLTAKERFFIIRLKDYRKSSYDSQILQHLRRMQDALTPLEQLIRLKRKFLVKTQDQIVGYIHDAKVSEKISVMTQSQLKKLGRKLEKLPEEIIETWREVQASEGFRQALQAPRRSVEFSRLVITKARHHCNVFMKSETRHRLEKVAKLTWTKGKNSAVELYKFVFECYFEKPKAIKLT